MADVTDMSDWINKGLKNNTLKVQPNPYSETQTVSSPTGGEMAIEKLYPFQDQLSPQFATAITLLNTAENNAQEALESFRNGDIIGSDNAIMQLHALLPELFCCRDIGEGFGALINAIYYALANRKGEPLMNYNS